MSQKNDSEEKNLPPSARKLRQAREKGQVAKSKDATTAAVMLVCTLYVFIATPGIVARIENLLDQIAAGYGQPFDHLWPRFIAAGLAIVFHAIVPLVLFAALAVLIVNIVVMQGLVFSADPIAPKPERIHPADGLKRLFSIRQVIELLKSLVKMAALMTALIVVYRTHLPALMESSLCEHGCIRETFMGLMKPLVITALSAFLVVGILDVFMQRWLFRRDQRMSKTEQKRERKDQQGDPTFRRERRRLNRDMLTGGKTGLRNASIVVGDPGGWVVGIRYAADEVNIPFLASRDSGDAAKAAIKQAESLGLPIATDAGLAQYIAENSAPGYPVPEKTFQEVANILVAARLL